MRRTTTSRSRARAPFLHPEVGGSWRFTRSAQGSRHNADKEAKGRASGRRPVATRRLTEGRYVSTVLVADDDRDIRDLVTFKLESAGFTVIAASDGDEAFERIVTSRPDLAVLDVMMPGRSGTQVLQQVREHPQVGRTRIILLTAKAQEADVEAGFLLGADDYVVKPFSPRELLSRVQAVLARGPS